MKEATRDYLRTLRRRLDYERSVWTYAVEYLRPTAEMYDAMPPSWGEAGRTS